MIFQIFEVFFEILKILGIFEILGRFLKIFQDFLKFFWFLKFFKNFEDFWRFLIFLKIFDIFWRFSRFLRFKRTEEILLKKWPLNKNFKDILYKNHRKLKILEKIQWNRSISRKRNYPKNNNFRWFLLAEIERNFHKNLRSM